MFPTDQHRGYALLLLDQFVDFLDTPKQPGLGNHLKVRIAKDQYAFGGVLTQIAGPNMLLIEAQARKDELTFGPYDTHITRVFYGEETVEGRVREALKEKRGKDLPTHMRVQRAFGENRELSYKMAFLLDFNHAVKMHNRIYAPTGGLRHITHPEYCVDLAMDTQKARDATKSLLEKWVPQLRRLEDFGYTRNELEAIDEYQRTLEQDFQ